MTSGTMTDEISTKLNINSLTEVYFLSLVNESKLTSTCKQLFYLIFQTNFKL
jgi:hypothetical protein